MKSMFTNRRYLQLPFAVVIFVVALLLWLALRVVLWMQVGPSQMQATQSASAFIRGEWFDLATLAYLLVPVLLVSAMLPNAWRVGPMISRLRWIVLAIMIGTLLFGAVAEFVFWDEFTTRFNFIAVDYLIYTSEVIGNIRQSYPVGLIVSVIVVTTILIT